MIANAKGLTDFINTILNKHGFIQKRGTWYKHTEECICFFVIEKSPYGGYYDEAFGFFLKAINDTEKEYPEYYKCDLKIGLEFFYEKEFVKRIFNLENQEFVNLEREFIISEMFDLYIIPFLKNVESEAGVRSAMEKYNDLIYYLNLDAIKYLGLQSPDD